MSPEESIMQLAQEMRKLTLNAHPEASREMVYWLKTFCGCGLRFRCQIENVQSETKNVGRSRGICVELETFNIAEDKTTSGRK